MNRVLVVSALLIFCMGILFPCKIFASDWLLSDNKIFDKINLDSPGLENVKLNILSNNLCEAKKEYLQYKRESKKGRWINEPFVQSITTSEQISAADSLCLHYIYDDINSKKPYVEGLVYMGEDFDWLYNPRTKTDQNYAPEWTYSCVSRINFLNRLVDAYKETGNSKYLQKCIWFMHDFAKDNPKSIKAMWRPLDTAIRVRTWLNIYFAFRNSELFTPEDNMLLVNIIYEHGESLKNTTINRPDRTGNHVTTECSALYTLGCIFPEIKNAEEWRNVARDRFLSEINKVVPPDGLQAELSPSYHYGVVAAYKSLVNIAKINDIELPDNFVEKLMAMYRAPVLLIDQQGDFVKTNDSGDRDIRALSKEGMNLLGYDPLLAWAASNGKEGIAPSPTTFLPYAGFYMMRSGWTNNDTFLFFRGGPQGIGHAEQEKLQIVFKAWGETLLFDPGKYPYDQSDWRRFSINTPSHNTVIVDGKWQYREKVIPETYQPVNNPFYTTPMFDFVSSTYDAGYVTNIYDPSRSYQPQIWMNDRDTSVVHKRSILYLKPNYALVLDNLDSDSVHTYDAHFHMDAINAVFDTKNNVIYSDRNSDVQLAIFPLNGDKLETEIIKGQEDSLLGWYPLEHRPIPTVRFRKKEANAVFASFLYPYRKEKPVISTEDLTINTSLWSKRIVTKNENFEIVLNSLKESIEVSIESKLVGSIKAKLSGLVIKTENDNDSRYYGGWNIDSYKDDFLNIKFSHPIAGSFIVEKNKIKIFNASNEAVTIDIKKPLVKKLTVEPQQWIEISKNGKK